MEDLREVEVLLSDEKYRDLLTEYINLYSEILKIIPKRKLKLLVDFRELTEKIINRRFELLLNIEVNGDGK